MGLRPMVRALTHGRWYVICISKSGALLCSNAKIAPLVLNRRSTADVQEYLHHGPDAPCHLRYMFECPQHHQSETADYCSICGAAIAPVAVSEETTGERCPECQAVRENHDQVFCEVCGFNFRTQQAGVPIPVEPTAAKPANPSLAIRWDLIVNVDQNLYGNPNPDAPTDRPEQTFTLFETENILGRAAPGVRVQIPISHDGGLSRRHALFKRSPQGLSIRDLGSANGTQLNGVDLLSGVETSLKDGDVLAVGAWTKITIRAVNP